MTRPIKLDMEDWTDEAISVGELIEMLSELDPMLPVEVEGCDCNGAATGIELRDANKYLPFNVVIICR